VATAKTPWLSQTLTVCESAYLPLIIAHIVSNVKHFFPLYEKFSSGDITIKP
jgi:hypothetical protein